ncbi:hypothetical protein ACHAQA_005676 [Verticillium albo-atrum]
MSTSQRAANWKSGVRGFEKWLTSAKTGSIASIVAPPMSGKSETIPQIALQTCPSAAKVVYALPSRLEQGAYVDCIGAGYPVDMQECSDEATDDDAQFWVVTHNTLDKLLNEKFPDNAVVILDHEASCSAQYVSVWIQLMFWVTQEGGYRRVVVLSDDKVPYWQLQLTEGIDMVFIGMDVQRELGWSMSRKASLPVATWVESPEEVRKDVEEELVDFEHSMGSRTKYPVALFIAPLRDTESLLPPANMPRPAVRAMDPRERTCDTTPLDMANEHTVLAIPPDVRLSGDIIRNLGLRCITHVFLLGRGERGAVFDEDIGTVVYDTTIVGPTQDEIARVGFYLSMDPDASSLHKLNTYVPQFPATEERREAMESLGREFANRDVYAAVFKTIEMCVRTGMPWHLFKRALASGCGGIPRATFEEIARRLEIMGCIKASEDTDCPYTVPQSRGTVMGNLLPLVDYNFSAAYILAGVSIALEREDVDVQVQQVLVYMAFILANATKCRDAIDIDPNKENMRGYIEEYSAEAVYKLTSQGFLWSVLGLWLAAVTSAGDKWLPCDCLKVDRAAFQKMHSGMEPVLKKMMGTRLIPVELFGQQAVDRSKARQVMAEVFCSSIFRVVHVPEGSYTALDPVARVQCGSLPHCQLLSRRQAYQTADDGGFSGFYAVLSDHIHQENENGRREWYMPDMTLVHSETLQHWQTHDLCLLGRPLREVAIDLGSTLAVDHVLEYV